MSEGTEKHLEHAEHSQHAAHNPFDRRVAMTMAIIAALLAGVTLVSHRGHTETLRLATVAGSKHTEATDIWNLYQAKNIRSHEFQSYLLLEEMLAEGKQNDNAKAMRNYWISQIDKYEGEGYWPAFLASIKEKKQKPERSNHSELYKLETEAKGLKAEAENNEQMSHKVHGSVTWIDLGHLGLELALVLCAVAVLTKQRPFWLAGIGVAVVGAVLAAVGLYGWWLIGAAEAAAGGHH
jgi:hypothetical protein